MNKIDYKALIISIFIAMVTFIIVEFLIEIILLRPYGISESVFITELKPPLAGAMHTILNLIIFILLMSVIITVHVALRPRFSSDIKAALVTSSIFLAVIFLLVANLVNLGFFPWKLGLLVCLFNLIKLPIAIMAAALAYSARTADNRTN